MADMSVNLPLSGGDSREDQVALPQRSSRRKGVPKDRGPSSPEAAQHDPVSGSPIGESSKARRRRSRQRYMRKSKSESEAFHAETSVVNTPLHHFTQPPGENAYQTPDKSLREGKEMLARLLNNESSESQCYAVDGSTASTSGSNSSSASEAACQQLKPSNSETNSIDCDKELELYSRQIRIELRQAEMIELAEEAERAAASGQKSFAGRASTFGGDESEIEIALEGIKTRITPSSQRKVRRTLEFGTPLGRRLSLGTPLTRRLSLEPEKKISVKALRDVAEVVPSFKDFHFHLRTHFLRRKVNKRSLVFVEEGNSRIINANARSGHQSLSDIGSTHNHQTDNMMHLWNSLNFGSWAMGSEKGTAAFDKQRDRGKSKEGRLNASQTFTDAGIVELLADHKHTPLIASRGPRRPPVQIPPGLGLHNDETFELHTDEKMNLGEVVRRLNRKQLQNANADVDGTPSLVEPTPKQPRFVSAPTPSERNQLRQVYLSSHPDYALGSPNSPIIVDDVGVAEESMFDQRAGRLNYGPSLPVGLPLTPNRNVQSVFDSSDERLKGLLATPIVDVEGPDFVTPVRLRDIRDNNRFGRAVSSRLPEEPFVSLRMRSSSITETPVSKFEDTEEMEHSTRLCDAERRSLYFQIACQSDDAPNSTEGYNRHFGKGLSMRPSIERIGPNAVDALIGIGARATGASQHGIVYHHGRIDPTIVSSAPLFELSTPAKFNESDKDGIPNEVAAANEAQVIIAEAQNQSSRDLRHCTSMPSLSGTSCNKLVEDGILQRGVSYDAQQIIRLDRAVAIASCGDGDNKQLSPLKHGEATLRPHSRDCLLGREVETCRTGRVDSYQGEVSLLESQAHVSDFVLGITDANRMDLNDGSVASNSKPSDQSKATADFGCECLISPASSLESDEGEFQLEVSKRRSSWNLMEHHSMALSDSNHQPLQAAVAMFSRMSPKCADDSGKRVYYASSKENDDFLNNYLYCSKTAEETPAPEPICSGGSAQCQDAKMPCGEVAVDSCVSNFLETALKFLPRKTSQSKLLSLSRDKENEVRSKHLSWYDLANEKFDRLLESLMGDEGRNDDQCRLSYQAPILKERNPYETPQKTPPRTPALGSEASAADLKPYYIQTSSSLDLSPSQGSQQSRGSVQIKTSEQSRMSIRERCSADAKQQRRFLQTDLLQSAMSDTIELKRRQPDAIRNRISM